MIFKFSGSIWYNLYGVSIVVVYSAFNQTEGGGGRAQNQLSAPANAKA